MTSLSFETLHASCVSIGGRAVLISGRSGSGKSDLALRLIDRGARLVSDDYTIVRRNEEALVAEAPETIAGKIEVRGVGIVEMDSDPSVPVALVVDLDSAPERMPTAGDILVAGCTVPRIALAGLEASAPLKVELALGKIR
jgi:serine kinase of HPr protein (carbohydrate metabolism regulator)